MSQRAKFLRQLLGLADEADPIQLFRGGPVPQEGGFFTTRSPELADTYRRMRNSDDFNTMEIDPARVFDATDRTNVNRYIMQAPNEFGNKGGIVKRILNGTLHKQYPLGPRVLQSMADYSGADAVRLPDQLPYSPFLPEGLPTNSFYITRPPSSLRPADLPRLLDESDGVGGMINFADEDVQTRAMRAVNPGEFFGARDGGFDGLEGAADYLSDIAPAGSARRWFDDQNDYVLQQLKERFGDRFGGITGIQNDGTPFTIEFGELVE